MKILFHNDLRILGTERRIKSNRKHWHIIIFHKNICLGILLDRGIEHNKNPIIDLFYNGLCKK